MRNWTVEKKTEKAFCSITGERKPDGHFYLIKDENKIIAQTMHVPPFILNENACINANIISAAPEMYSLTKKVAELFKCTDGLLTATGGCNKILCEILAMVPADIANKAEGK